MAEIEYGGIKVGGSKLILVLPLLGTMQDLGQTWDYKGYTDMKIIANMVTNS